MVRREKIKKIMLQSIVMNTHNICLILKQEEILSKLTSSNLLLNKDDEKHEIEAS